MDGQSLRHAARICIRDRISRSARFSAHLDRHPLAGGPARVLQGCGGAMMIPVGRLTMVRAFAKSELIRAMAFVAIPV